MKEAGHMDRNYITALCVAADRYDAARSETRRRREIGLDWMRAKPETRTLGEATAYTGLHHAMDLEKSARQSFYRAARELVRAWRDSGEGPLGGDHHPQNRG